MELVKIASNSSFQRLFVILCKRPLRSEGSERRATRRAFSDAIIARLDYFLLDCTNPGF
jgi:hypothetical protein